MGERKIVGIVGDIRVRGLESTSEPQVYLPNQQVPDGAIISYTPKDLVIRASTNALSLMPSIRQIIRKADPDQPISDVQMLSDIVEGETAPRGTQLRVIGVFAAIAIFLARHRNSWFAFVCCIAKNARIWYTDMHWEHNPAKF